MSTGSYSFEYRMIHEVPAGGGDEIAKTGHVGKATDVSVEAPGGVLMPDETFTEVENGHTRTYTYAGAVSENGQVIGFAAVRDGHTYIFTNTALPANTSGLLIDPSQDFTLCFMAGTAIATPDGPVAVETLAKGDLVCTADGDAAPVRWVGRQTVSTVFADPLRVMPIRVRAGALADNVPVRDLLVSPDHALLVDGVLVHAAALVNGLSIVRETRTERSFVYYHVELADHSLILAESVPAETFIDNADRMAFDNWNEHEAAAEPGVSIAELPYPRAKSCRQVPQAISQRLNARAVALFAQPVAAAA
jgi:hypothetical protein